MEVKATTYQVLKAKHPKPNNNAFQTHQKKTNKQSKQISFHHANSTNQAIQILTTTNKQSKPRNRKLTITIKHILKQTIKLAATTKHSKTNNKANKLMLQTPTITQS